MFGVWKALADIIAAAGPIIVVKVKVETGHQARTRHTATWFLMLSSSEISANNSAGLITHRYCAAGFAGGLFRKSQGLLLVVHVGDDDMEVSDSISEDDYCGR